MNTPVVTVPFRKTLLTKTALVPSSSVLLASTALALLLGGCTTYDETFDCPIGKGIGGKGIGCQSVTEVKKKLNQGAIPLPETTTEASRHFGSRSPLLPHPPLPVVSKWGTSIPSNGPKDGFKDGPKDGPKSDSNNNPLVVVDSNGTVIERAREKPLRVWIAPYQDQEGNLHEASVVHTVVKPGYWQIQ